MKDKEEVLRVFGNKVKELRKEKGLTQEQLGKLVGYKGKEAISKIECGKIDISQPRVNAIAKALDVSPTVFFLFDYQDEISLKDSEDYLAIIEVINTADEATLHKIRRLVEVFRIID